MSDPIAPELIEANKAKLEAEAEAARSLARKNDAEARKFNVEADSQVEFVLNQRMQNEIGSISLEQSRRLRRLELAQDQHHHVYRFAEGFTESSVRKCVTQLVAWRRLAEEEGLTPDIEIEFYSPGGSVFDGLVLFDTIEQLKKAGFFVTTSATGMAASMGGILLQAGNKRVMAAEAWVLIHQVSAGVRGKVPEMEDEVEFMKKIQDRILSIFAARCKQAHEADPTVCTHPLTKAQLRKGWDRKDWWISSSDCLRFGLVDEVR